jgi:hypothetical protein
MAVSLASLAKEPLRGKLAIFTHIQQHRLSSEATATLLQIASTARLVRQLGALRAYNAIKTIRNSQKEADHV